MRAEVTRQLGARAKRIAAEFDLSGDRKVDLNPFTIWRNWKLARQLRTLELTEGIDAVAERLPSLVVENPGVQGLYTAAIELYVNMHRFNDAYSLCTQARARFPRIAQFELCEEGLEAVLAAPTVESKEQQKLQLEANLTALRWALLGR